MRSDARKRLSSASSFGTGTLTSTIEFYTWREAVLTACEAADRFTTATKPSVRWRADRWVLTYTYRPVAMNGAVS